MNFEKISEKLNGKTQRTRVIIGVSMIAAALFWGLWDAGFLNDQVDGEAGQATSKSETEDERKAREVHEKFFNSSGFKKQPEAY